MAIMRHEFQTARRERLPQIILIVFIALIGAASFIGWLTHTTVTNVYNEALREGVTHQINPFSQTSALDPLKNIVIYVALIGALLAILLGVQSALRDRKARSLDLVFSRPISKRRYVCAKFAGVCLWLGGIMIIAAGTTWLSLWLIQSKPLSVSLTGNLFIFFGISWLFLTPFTAIGMMSGFMNRRETTALLTPILVWVLLTFVVPQLGTAEEPISFLNPVPAQVSSSGAFFQFNHRLLQPISYIDHYKQLSARTLGYAQDPSWRMGALEAGLVAISGIAVMALVTPLFIRRGELYE
jgi:ABC-2 type transport system permease protein